MNRKTILAIVVFAIAMILLLLADITFAQAPIRAVGAPQAVGVKIVITSPDGSTQTIVGVKGSYSVAITTHAIDLETGNHTETTKTTKINIGGSVIPDEDTVPPFLEPGPRFILVIAERDDQTPAIAGMRATVLPKLTESGHSYRWIDDDAVTGKGAVPVAYARHIKAAKATPGPDMWILTRDDPAVEVYSGVAPVVADAFFDLVRKSGGAIK